MSNKIFVDLISISTTHTHAENHVLTTSHSCLTITSIFRYCTFPFFIRKDHFHLYAFLSVRSILTGKMLLLVKVSFRAQIQVCFPFHFKPLNARIKYSSEIKLENRFLSYPYTSSCEKTQSQDKHAHFILSGWSLFLSYVRASLTKPSSKELSRTSKTKSASNP